MNANEMFETGEMMLSSRVNFKAAANPLFEERLYTYIGRYMNCDWGDVNEADSKANSKAVKDGYGRIVAVYRDYATGTDEVMIITEPDRSATTVMFPDEY